MKTAFAVGALAGFGLASALFYVALKTVLNTPEYTLQLGQICDRALLRAVEDELPSEEVEPWATQPQ